MTIYEKMHQTKLYNAGEADLLEEQTGYLDKLYDFNQTRPTEGEKRMKMLKEMFADIGENCYIEPPFHANFGGHHVHFGTGVYANFNLTLVDDTHIYVGDYTMFGPNVVLRQRDIRSRRSCGREDISTMHRSISETIVGLVQACL